MEVTGVATAEVEPSLGSASESATPALDPMAPERRAEFREWLALVKRRGYPISSDTASLNAFFADWSGSKDDYLEIVTEGTGRDTSRCAYGDELDFTDEMYQTVDEGSICEDCRQHWFVLCHDCESYSRRGASFDIHDHGWICSHCYQTGNYASCLQCGEIFPTDEMAETDNGWYCSDHEPNEESSDCSPRHLEFTFPALCTPQKSIRNDEIIPVTVGSGEISPQGLQAVRSMIFARTMNRATSSGGLDLYELRSGEFDPTWQNKEGNFPKRLAKHLLLKRNLKLSEELLAECGNLAKRYTSTNTTHYISLTRDLNQEPRLFHNKGSCWWGEYAYSRCELKAWNGLAVRTWDSPQGERAEQFSGYPASRAWLLPLKVEDGRIITDNPTNKIPADAYVLFNSYGDLEQLPYARIIAGMTGKSYKKIGFGMNAYINAGGVLIAEQSICDAYSELQLSPIQACGCH